MKIFYITRSYFPDITGGTLSRKAQVNNFKKNGIEVFVVTPEYKLNNYNEENLIKVPITYSLRIANYLERIGILEDYLDFWVYDTIKTIAHLVQPSDIVFATSGGELGCVKLGSLLKSKTNCKFVVNLHDPIDYTIVNGKKLDNRFHVSREKSEKKYLSNADLIITSSQINKKSLKKKYSLESFKIENCYIGYLEKLNLISKKRNEKLTIAYGGAFSRYQSPEVLAHIARDISDVKVCFIGNFEDYEPLRKYYNLKNISFIKALQHHEFLNFMMQNVDIGFVSLANDYLGACVPSKIYEYINLGLPILGSLPSGDGIDIINNNDYGIAFKYNDYRSIKSAVVSLLDPHRLSYYKMRVLKDRDKWSVDENMKLILEMIRNI